MDPNNSDSGDGVTIIGAGHAGGRAAQQLRSFGYNGKITLIGSEPHAPYERPPLSKGVLREPGSEIDAFIAAPEWYEKNDVTLLTSTTVAEIDRSAQCIGLMGGERIPYDRLIIATGGRLRHLDVPGSDLGNVFYLRSMSDAIVLRDALKSNARLVVIGGGFIGLEVAGSARRLGLDVHVVEAADRLMGRAVPKIIGTICERLHTDRGIKVTLDQSVTCLEGNETVEAVCLDDGRKLAADVVVVGIGIQPESELAERAGLKIDDGILVNVACQTSDPAIYAIGDVACQMDSQQGRPRRTESWQNAEYQAACAAADIAGRSLPDAEPTWFWSDQHDLHLQIIGRPREWNDLLARGSPGDGPFVLFRMEGHRVLGAIGLNAKREMLLTRKLLAADRPVDPDALADTKIPLKQTVLDATRAS